LYEDVEIRDVKTSHLAEEPLLAVPTGRDKKIF